MPASRVARFENVTNGHAYIKSTFNNTIVSLTDPTGAVVAWASSGQVGFKGSRKSTPFAAQLAAEAAARRAQEHGMKKVDVFVKVPAPAVRPRSVPSRPPARDRLDPGRHASGLQRHPPAEAPPRLTCGREGVSLPTSEPSRSHSLSLLTQVPTSGVI